MEKKDTAKTFSNTTIAISHRAPSKSPNPLTSQQCKNILAFFHHLWYGISNYYGFQVCRPQGSTHHKG